MRLTEALHCYALAGCAVGCVIIPCRSQRMCGCLSMYFNCRQVGGKLLLCYGKGLGWADKLAGNCTSSSYIPTILLNLLWHISTYVQHSLSLEARKSKGRYASVMVYTFVALEPRGAMHLNQDSSLAQCYSTSDVIPMPLLRFSQQITLVAY